MRASIQENWVKLRDGAVQRAPGNVSSVRLGGLRYNPASVLPQAANSTADLVRNWGSETDIFLNFVFSALTCR